MDEATPEPKTPAFCPSAKTLFGFNPAKRTHRLVPLRCKRWCCRFCRSRNIYHLQKKAASGRPNRFLTLTTRITYGETPQQAHDRCRPQISRLFSKIRKRYGAFEACCVLERTARGWPHWHILVRSAFIHQHWLSATWKKLTGSYIVDVRQVKSSQLAARYVAKYITKAMAEPPQRRLGRVISFTRHYLPPKSHEHLLGWIWELKRDLNWWDARETMRNHYLEEPARNGWLYTPKNPTPAPILPTIESINYPPCPKYHVNLSRPPT